MKKLATVMIMAVWAAVPRLDAEDVKPKQVQFALTGTVSMGAGFEGESSGHLGPGVRADLPLGKEITITWEAMYILSQRSIIPAVTLNVRIAKRAYAGAGALVTWATFDGAPVTAFKARLGMKDSHTLFELHYVVAKASAHTWGGEVKMIGMTFGYIF